MCQYLRHIGSPPEELFMSRNTSVEIGDDLGLFIDYQVQSGRYSSASEVVRAGLRHLQTEETKLAALRASVQAGIDSGVAEPFEMEAFIQERKIRRA